MNSLSRHLLEPDDHGRLSFHPDCPVCRCERLAGTLSVGPVVSRRAQATLAAALLAVGTVAPTTAAAVEPDQQYEGSAPEGPDTPDPAQSPDFDPGGESAELPLEAAPPPQLPGPADPAEDPGPLEQEPAGPSEEPIADPGDGPAEPVSQEPATAPVPVPAPEVESPAPSRKPAEERTREPRKTVRAKRRTASGKRTQPVAQAPQPAAGAAVPQSAAPAQAATRPAPTPNPPSGGDLIEPGARVHVVRPGESLWSIANDLLGSEATAARIAHEVNRLWQLNRDRIRTGDPDLLLVGTRLELR